MQLEGIRTVYKEEVAYIPGQGVAPTGLDPQAMGEFCSPNDADQIFAIAVQVVKGAKLVGKTGKFTSTLGQNGVLAPGPDQIHAESAAGGRYEYGTADGYRPIRIQSVADGLDQFVSELVTSYDGTKNGLTLVTTGQGKKLQWA